MSDRKYLVLTAVGKDRPGLVSELASAINSAGANLEDSRMAILGGEFAVLLLVSGQPTAIEEVRRRGADLETKLGLSCVFRETDAPAGARDYVAYRIRVSGVDHPGIVQKVSESLATRDINLASLESRVQFAPLSGTAMFVLDADLQVPSATALSELRKQLSQICEDENLDFVLETS